MMIKLQDITQLENIIASANMTSIECETWIRRSNEVISDLHQKETEGLEEVAVAQPYNDDEYNLMVITDVNSHKVYKFLIVKGMKGPFHQSY